MELHFSGAANPIAPAVKLNGCLLFKRTRGVATARDNDVWCTFEAAVTKQKLMQACAMTFRHWGGADAAMAYQEHRVVDTRPALTQAAASSSAASGSAASGSVASGSEAAPVNQLALRNGVEEVNALAQGMTPAECHALAIYFSLRAVGTGQGCTDMEAILAWKHLASRAFLLPVMEWESEMQKHTPAIPPKVKQCQCRCGCTNQAVGLQWCMGRVMPECNLGGQRRAVCVECLDAAPPHGARLLVVQRRLHGRHVSTQDIWQWLSS